MVRARSSSSPGRTTRPETSRPRYDAEAIKASCVISEEVRSSGVDLSGGPHTWKGLCPFHEERTPSFYVDDRDGHYHCYGCGAHGDVIDWMQQLYRLGFPEACERLGAGRAAPTVRPPKRPPPRRWDQLTLLEQDVMNRAATVYSRSLARHGRVRAYLADRGLGPEVVRACVLGYSDGRTLLACLESAGPEYVATALSLGLLRDKGSGPRELLSGRVVVPEIRSGNCIWMTGRALEDAGPKYLSLDGERPVLGWERASGRREVVLTEGVFDYLTAISWGYAAVCTCGTSLPPERLGLLARADRVYCVFDSDEAGRDAGERFRQLLGARYVGVELPEGKDLNDLGREEGGRERFRELLESARDALGPRVHPSAALA